MWTWFTQTIPSSVLTWFWTFSFWSWRSFATSAASPPFVPPLYGGRMFEFPCCEVRGKLSCWNGIKHKVTFKQGRWTKWPSVNIMSLLFFDIQMLQMKVHIIPPSVIWTKKEMFCDPSAESELRQISQKVFKGGWSLNRRVSKRCSVGWSVFRRLML